MTLQLAPALHQEMEDYSLPTPPISWSFFYWDPRTIDVSIQLNFNIVVDWEGPYIAQCICSVGLNKLGHILKFVQLYHSTYICPILFSPTEHGEISIFVSLKLKICDFPSIISLYHIQDLGAKILRIYNEIQLFP